jgi:uncharacterized protein YbaA (DUF1428 family)
MTYIDGFVAAVPTANREAYRAHAEKMVPLFRRLGATAIVENWGSDVPDGKVTSLPMAVKAKPDETVVFSWVAWPDKATRDAAWATLQTDPEMRAIGDMPFDGQRMIFGGFDTILEA